METNRTAANTNTRLRVKFCGITNVEDAHAAAALGIDALGFIFYPPAKTAVDAATACEVKESLPAFVSSVAVFFNASKDEVQAVVDAMNPSTLQFHGDEDANFCEQFNTPYIKTCRIQAADDVVKTAVAHPHCCALLVDTFVKDKPGGSGQTFDWKLLQVLADESLPPLILAGGLTASNVGEAVRAVAPLRLYGVDVSSGISEDESPRHKNCDKMAAFMNTLNTLSHV